MAAGTLLLGAAAARTRGPYAGGLRRVKRRDRRRLLAKLGDRVTSQADRRQLRGWSWRRGAARRARQALAGDPEAEGHRRALLPVRLRDRLQLVAAACELVAPYAPREDERVETRHVHVPEAAKRHVARAALALPAALPLHALGPGADPPARCKHRECRGARRPGHIADLRADRAARAPTAIRGHERPRRCLELAQRRCQRRAVATATTAAATAARRRGQVVRERDRRHAGRV